MKRLASICLLLVPAWAGAQALPGARLEELFALARGGNPELVAMSHEARAAEARIEAAGALPDPMARVELRDPGMMSGEGNFNLLPGRAGSTRYSLTQTFPFWGKRELRREIASAEAQAANARAATLGSELRARLRSAYANYYHTAQLLELNAEVLALAQSMEQLAQGRYASGLAPQADALRAQVERAMQQGERASLDAEHHHNAARLNALLRRASTAALAPPTALPALPPPAALDPAALEEQLLAANPQLANALAMSQAAGKNREAVYRNRYPDFTLGVAPTQSRRRVAEWELMFEINIPLQQGTRRAQETEALELAAAAQARGEALRLQLLSELAESLRGIESARRLANLAAGELVPQAELGLAGALAAYENGKADFATVLEAQRALRKLRADELKARVDGQLRYAELERLLGVPL